MVAVARSGWRRVAGSALHQGAKAAGFLHQGAPAAGGILQQAAGVRRFPILARFMSSKNPEFVVMEEGKFKELVKVVEEVQQLKVRDANYLERFRLLASCRGALPLQLSGSDRLVVALKDQFVPSNTDELRRVLFKVSMGIVVGSMVGFECSSWKAVGGTYDQFAKVRHPWVYAFVTAFFTRKEGAAASEEGGAAASEEGGAAGPPF